MKSIKELVMRETRPVHIHLPSKSATLDFLKVAEKEGFLFGDGKRPTKKPLDDYYALHQDLTMNYIGYLGRIYWKSDDDKVLRIEYRDLFV
ncbi:MAG: hypothetical protein ACI4QE_02870 [Acutalibacteraceae bacterium]